MRNRSALLAAAATILLAAAVAPSIFFYWRDNFSTHFPYRAAMAGAPALHLWNPLVGGGQPLGGNPNALAFYPDWILFAVLPPLVAFNLHFLLHWILGAVATRALLRQWNVRAPYDAVGAALWALSGAVVSTFAFYNLVTAVALVPLALLGAERLAARATPRGAVLFGAAFGLLALAGEPVTLLATAGVALVLLAAGPREQRRRLPLWIAVAVGVALLIASPLLLAWSEIAGETERGVRPYSAETVLAASLTPWQLAEAVLGPVRGLATDLGERGWRASGADSRWPPLFLSLFVGALAIPALASPPRAMRRVQIAALALLVMALGRFNPLVAGLFDALPAARVLRYPEKLALPLSLLVTALLAAWLTKETRGRLDRAAAAGGMALGILVAALAARSSVLSDATKERALLAAAVAVPLFALATVRPSTMIRRALTAITLGMAAIFAATALPVDLARYYAGAPPIPPGARIVRVVGPEAPARTAREQYRRAAASAEPVWGAAFGGGYALEKSPDGMYAFLSRIVHERVRTGDPRKLARWSRIAGASAVLTARPLRAAELGAPVAVDGVPGLFAQTVRAPLPLVHPVRVRATASISEAIEILERDDTDLLEIAAGPPGSASDTLPAVLEAERIADGWRITTDPRARGTILVNETWFGAWRARDQSGRELRVGPLNVDRVGISVPPGTSSIELRFGRRRTAITIGWVVSTLVLLGAAVVAGKRSQ